MAGTVPRVDEIRSRKFEFPPPGPNTVGRLAEVSPEGCVVHLEKDSAPRLLWYGEDIWGVKLPAGTRVIYPKPTVPGLKDRKAGIRYAIAHPEEMEPLEALLKPGMRVTICIAPLNASSPWIGVKIALRFSA